MSIGRLVVELELKDGQYTSRMRQAGTTAQQLSGQLGQLNTKLGGIEKGISGAIPHLRDIAVVTSGLHSVFSMASDTVGSFVHSLVKANAEVERTSVLLQGLSKSVDSQGKLRDAAKDMNFLYEAAKQSPFALKELSNSFVKMKVVGMVDVESKLKAITNAIANFGGNDESLHRTTVALQQMASKGVISMEELRQQLGESVPSAMQNMADGMGMTMGSMVKAISEGKVRAIPAIDGMMKEMEFSMSGSSARMMNTWNGLMSQLETNWTLLQKKVGDNGSFDAVKDSLKGLNEFLQGDEASKYAQKFGDGLKSVIDTVGKLSKAWESNSEAIGKTLKIFLEFWAISKALKGAGALFGAGKSIAGEVSAAHNSFKKEVGAIMNPTVGTRKLSNWGNNSMTGGINEGVTSQNGGRMSAISESLPKDIGSWAAAVGIVGAALKLIPGPLGAIATAVALVGSQFIEFGNKAVTSLDDVAAKQRELNAKPLRVDGDAALKTIEDINLAKQNLEELTAIRDKLSADIEKERHKGLMGNQLADGKTRDAPREMVDQLASYNDIIKVSQQAIQESQRENFNNQIAKQKQLAQAEVETVLASTTTEYKIKVDAINKNADQFKEISKKTDDEVNAYKRAAMLKLHEETLTLQDAKLNQDLKNQERLKLEAINTAKAIAPKGQKDSITLFVGFNEERQALESLKQQYVFNLAQIQSEMGKTADVAKKAELAKNLTQNEEAIKVVDADLLGVNNEIDKIKSNQIDWQNILKFESANTFINAITAKLKDVGASLGLVKKNILPSDGALSGVNDKELEKQIKAINDQRADNAAKANKLQGLKSKDPKAFVYKDSEAFKLDYQREEMVKKGEDTANIDRQIALKNQEASYDAQIASQKEYNSDSQSASKKHDAEILKGINHTIAEKERIDNQQIAQANQKDEYLMDLDIKMNRELNTSKIAASRDALAIQKQTKDASITAAMEAAHDKGVVLDKEKAALKASLEQQYDAVRDYNNKIYIEDKRAASNHTIASSKIARGVGLTSKQRDLRAAEENYNYTVTNLKLQGNDSGKLAADLENEKNIYIEKQAEIAYNHRNAFQQMTQDTIDFNMVAGQAAADFTNGMVDGLANMIVNGTSNFKDFTRTILAGISQMIIKMLMLQAIQSAIGMFGGGGSGGGSTMSATPSSGMNWSFDPSLMPKKYGGIVGGAYAFASGGAMLNNATKMTRGQMLAGGVKNTPQIALFAEADVPEAFIPMHDGRSIPLSVMRDVTGNLTAKALLPGGKSIPATIQESNFNSFAVGGIAGNISSDKVGGLSSSMNAGNAGLAVGGVSIVINVDNKGDGSTKQDGAGKNGTQDEMWSKMADNIKGMVVKTIVEQKRPGGALWST